MYTYIFIVYRILEKQCHLFISTRLILRSQCPLVKNGNNFVVRYNKMLLCYPQLSIYTYMFKMFIFRKLLLKVLVNETIECRLCLHLLTSSFLRVFTSKFFILSRTIPFRFLTEHVYSWSENSLHYIISIKKKTIFHIFF